MAVATDNDKKKTPLRSALGRGLDALIPRGDDAPAGAGGSGTPADGQPGSIFEVPLAYIEANPFQPRTTFDQEALEELADSIRAQGIIQPITVRRLNDTSFQLISGERRFRASQLVGLTHIPAYVRTANDEQMLEMAIIENIQREQLNPIEEARLQAPDGRVQPDAGKSGRQGGQEAPHHQQLPAPAAPATRDTG